MWRDMFIAVFDWCLWVSKSSIWKVIKIHILLGRAIQDIGYSI